MAAKYRVGVIASGRIAREHGRGWTECEHTEIVGCADAHPDALESYAADFNVKSTYLDLREMLDKEELDIISVCSWDPQHAEMTVAAAAAKPGGLRLPMTPEEDINLAVLTMKLCGEEEVAEDTEEEESSGYELPF